MQSPRGARRVCTLVIATALIAKLVSALPALAQGSEQIFERAATRIVQIRIVEADSGAKSAIGTGFVVGKEGELATNYHVIADLVHEPEHYRAEWVDAAGEGHPITLLGFDLVRDIAVLQAERAFAKPFKLHKGALRNGRRIYAVGNPFDLGMSIVEGAYNGFVEHSFYERIHFTGSLNPGMSGGPALLEDGSVVGINVASSGNQVSYLIPVDDLRRLLERIRAPGYELPEDRSLELREQLWRHQQRYFSAILEATPQMVQLGSYQAPGRLAPFFHCWGGFSEKKRHNARRHRCQTVDHIYLSDRIHIDVIQLRHRQIESDVLSPTRFYQLYSRFFERNWSELDGSDEDFSEFRCAVEFVETGGLVFKTAFCARRYLEFEGLYDVMFKAAHLGEPNTGFETALALTGISFENARALSRRYLEAIRWSE